MTEAAWRSDRSAGSRRIQTRRDQCVERRRDGQFRQVPCRPVDAVLARHDPLAQEHPDGLDRVQRDALRPFEDALDDRLGQARDEPGQQLAHLARTQRLEDERGEVAPAGTPVATAVEELGPGRG